MAEKPGVTILFEDPQEEITLEEAELPTAVVGPLYEVFEKEASDTTFDPLTSADQDFTWPSKRVGSVVDLAGTRNGFIDSQRRRLSEFVPMVYLVDGTNRYAVDDANINSLSQTGFSLTQEARAGLDRGSFNTFILDVNNVQSLYNPDGGLDAIEVGDRLEVGSNAYTVDAVTGTSVSVAEDASADLSTSTRVSQDEGGSVDVSVTPASTAGRVVVTVTGTDFASEAPALSVGDAAVTGIPMSGLTAIQGQLDTDLTTIDGLSFGVSTTLSAVEDYIVKVVSYDTDNTYTTVDQTSFLKVADIDTTAGTLTLDGALPGGADNDYVEVTILRGQIGYVESIASDNLSVTIVVPDTFSDTLSFVDIYESPTSVTAYPEFEVQVDYRALRADLADISNGVQTESQFLSDTGHAEVNSKDGLGWAVRTTILAQPNDRVVYYVPIDVEPTGSTGLSENIDLAAAYSNGLEVVESLPVYNVICLNNSQAVRDALKAHIDAMSTPEENEYRRGFFYDEVPLGETVSKTGEIAPGRVAGGIAGAASDGNTVIRDAGVEFVTDAGVVAGTQVVITFPEEFAGTRTALGTTTDNDLILDGDPFTLTKEFEFSSVSVNTNADGTHTISAASGTPIASGSFVHVEAGDYAEVEVGGTIYRLRVVSVNGAGTELVVEDEVPGDLDLGTGNDGNGTNFSVIRSWEGPNVKYYIRPLTKAQQVAKLIASKDLVGERYSVMLDYNPTFETGVDESGQAIQEVLDPHYTLCAIAAKRSGSRADQEVTNLFLGGGILNVDKAYNYFRNSQLRALSDAGFLLLEQQTSNSQPSIRDMITSDTSTLVSQEEVVIATADWAGKTLTRIFASPPGARLPKLTPRLLGVRAIQLDTILRNWIENDRIIDGRVVDVSQNASNKRQSDIVLSLLIALAEKEVEITIQRTI